MRIIIIMGEDFEYIYVCANSSQHHARDFAIIQIMPKNNLTMNLKCTFSIILAE